MAQAITVGVCALVLTGQATAGRPDGGISSTRDDRCAKNVQPTAHAGGNIDDAVVGEPIEFDASQSYDPDKDRGGWVKSFSWDFGDGIRGRGIQTKHTYSSPGTYELHSVAIVTPTKQCQM